MEGHLLTARFSNATVAVCLIAFFSACGGSDSAGDAGVKDEDGRVPFAVLKLGLMAGNEGDYDGAAKWVVPSGGMVGDNFQVWQKATNNGSVKSVEKTSEEYHGQNVMVGYRLKFQDGSTRDEKATMTKIDGRWKIEWLSTGFNF